MATYNGTLDTTDRSITHHGDTLWNTGSLTWGTYTSWVTHSSSSYGGALGGPLRYQTDIIDLGSTVTGYVEVDYNATGTIRVVIETSANSDMSSATFMGKYTTDNTETGTVGTHTWLDYYEEGYCDYDYNTFSARYLRITAFVELFDTVSTRGIPVLGKLNWAVKTDTVKEELNDVSVSGEAHTLTFSKIGTLTNIVVTPQNQTNKKLVAQVVSKANKTIRVVDNNAFNVSGQNATVDVSATGIPGAFTIDGTGIHLET